LDWGGEEGNDDGRARGRAGGGAWQRGVARRADSGGDAKG
jgi:hypothetical protein